MEDQQGEPKRQCRACQEWCDVSLFYKNKRRPDGLEAKCKPCTILEKPLTIYLTPSSTKNAGPLTELEKQFILRYFAEIGCSGCHKVTGRALATIHQWAVHHRLKCNWNGKPTNKLKKKIERLRLTYIKANTKEKADET